MSCAGRVLAAFSIQAAGRLVLISAVRVSLPAAAAAAHDDDDMPLM